MAAAEVVALGAGAKPAANWTMGEYLAHLNAAGLEAGHGHVTAADGQPTGMPAARNSSVLTASPTRTRRRKA